MFKGKDENMSGLLEEMHLFYFATKEFISLNWLTWASHFSHQFNMFAAFPMGRNGRNIRSLSQQGHLPRKWRKPLPQCWADTGRGQSWPAWYHEAQNRLVHLFPHLSLSLSIAILKVKAVQFWGYGSIWLSSGALLFISPASPASPTTI